MPESQSGTTRSSRRRLLLVDDNDEGRRALARLLDLYGFEVTTAIDGTSAIRALQLAPPPDVVLTDLLLPDLDGREVARLAHSLKPTPVIVMITGWDFGQDIPDREKWGIDFVFLKPLNVAELVSTLLTALSDRG